jgi:hypothetical protein
MNDSSSNMQDSLTTGRWRVQACTASVLFANDSMVYFGHTCSLNVVITNLRIVY